MQYSYKAKTRDGEIKSGKINAEDRSDLEAKLNNIGLTIIFAQESKKKEKKSFQISRILKRVSVMDKMLFARHLGVMLKAGLSFSRAITVLSEQTGNVYFREILESVGRDIQSGNQLADSLAKYPKTFDNLFVNMIRVGETGGNLEEVLDILYIQLKKEHELLSKVKGAMMYPAVIMLAMTVIGALMMTYVVPSLLKMFVEAEAELPISTKMIVIISNAFQNYGLFLLAGSILFIYLFLKIIKTKEGKKKFDFVLLHSPIMGKIVSKINMARFSRMLSSMIASGVSIVKALDIISETLGNTYYKESVKDACQEVQRGLALSEVVKKYDKLYHPLMINMIEVGEETGTIQETLEQVSEFYEDEVDQVTSNLSSIIEPVLMLVIGSAVGFFAISMIQPMYSIMETM